MDAAGDDSGDSPRQATDEAPSRPRRRRWWWVLGIAVVAVVGLSIPLLQSLRDLQTVGLDPSGARQRLSGRTPSTDGSPEVLVDESGQPVPTATMSPEPTGGPLPPAGDDEYRSFLVLGSDARAGLAGSRADVVILGLLPADGTAPILFSLPRDLWLPDPCHGGSQRINAAFNGCQDMANGFELSAIVVEDFTGIEVDHVVGIDFAGFTEVIDAVGGVRICVDNPVRDGPLFLPAGCTNATGTQALAWVRSRKTQELVDGEWRTMPGVNDLTRNRRQQDLVLQLLGRVGSFGTVGNLYSLADGVSDSVTVSDGLSNLDGARLVWAMRGRADEVKRFAIPVTDMVTSGGAQVLVPTEPFATTFEREVGVDLESEAAAD